MEKVVIYFLLFIFYSFLGWSMEVGLTLVNKKKFVNRGFLIGPYCPIYGYGCLLIILLLDKYRSTPFTLFIMSIVICSILEYLTSYFMEKLFHARWWDYSEKKYNINGRTCLETMIPFGILGCIMIYIVNPFAISLLTHIPTIVLYVIAAILLVIYITDNIISYNIINSFKHGIQKAEKDQTEEITKKVRSAFVRKGFLQKRLVKAFPNTKTSKELLLQIQKRINDAVEKVEKKAKKVETTVENQVEKTKEKKAEKKEKKQEKKDQK